MSTATDKAYEVMLGAYRVPERAHEREAWGSFLGEMPAWAVEETMARCLDIWDKAPIVGEVRREVGKVVALRAIETSQEHADRGEAVETEACIGDTPGCPAIEAINTRWAAEDATRHPDAGTPPEVVADRMRTIHDILDGNIAK